jgi:very-short-patch-repair endonuclease
MTDEEFKRYNNSRAITLKNMIKKYGKEEGTKVFNEYREKQRYKKSKQRYIDEFGEEQGLKIFKEINKKKIQSLENFQIKYGKEEGLRRYCDFLASRRCSFSKMASSLFRKTESSLNRNDITYIYQPKTEEFSIYQKNRSFFYDFCIPELKFIIEFNGDIFHGNPQLFNESDCPNPFDKTITAKQMWSNDKEKIDLAKSKGFEVMVIWERDYRNDPEAIMNNIIKTISEKLKNS